MSGMGRTLGTRCPPCRISWPHVPLAAACASVSCSHLGRLPDKGSFCQSSGQEATGEACKAVPEGARQPCAEPVEDAASVMSPLASPAPPTERLLPLASALSQSPTTSSISIHSHSSLSGSQPPEPFFPLDDLSPRPLALSPSTSCLHDSEAHFPPPTASSAPPLSDSTMTPPQCDLMALPLRTIPQSSSPHTPLSASPVAVPAISGLDYSSCSILTPSQWQAAAKALCLSNSSQCKSQQEHLSHHSQEALLRRDSTDRMVEAVSPSLLESDDQNLLEIQVTERIKIKISKEKDKDRLYPKQMSPDYHLNSLGKMLPSLGAEQDTTIPQPFWTAKDKPEQLPSPQQLSYPKVLGDHLQQKYNQLFWGLPSLHSESPVATAWISENSSTLQSPSFLFNGISNACPIHLQAKLPPLLSHSQPLPQLEFQPQALIPTMLQLQAPPLAQAQAHFQSPVQILRPSSPSQIRACGVSCPTARNELKSLTSIEIQNTEWPLLPKQLESGWAPPSVIERSQEVFNIFTPNLPEDSWVGSILPENFPISPELRKQLEQHLQKWLIQNRWELPRKIQESLELRQLQSELPGKCPVKDKHGASRPSSFTGESSKDPQKVGFQLKQDMSKVPKNLSRSSERPIVAFQEVDSEGSENDWMLLRKDLTSGLPRSLDKNLENIPKGHLGRNWGQTSEGLIPVSVRRSWLAVNHASPKSNAHMETRNLGILKGWEPWVNTSHRVSFLDTNTQKMLEAHMTKFWVRHMWGLPLKLIKSINHFTLKKVQPSPTLQFAFRPSAPCVPGDHSIVQLAEVLGKLPQPHLGEKAIGEESVPTLERTLLAPLPVCEEIQRALGQIPLGDDHGTTKASLARQEGRSPPQAITLTWQSGIVEWAMKDSTEPSPGSTMSRNEPGGKSGLHASRDPSHQVTVPEMNIGPQSLRAKEAREAGKATLSPAFQPESRDILGTNVLTKSQNKNAHLGSLEAPGTSKSPLYPRMTVLQDPGEPRLNTEMVSEFKSNVKVQSENLPHDCPRHKPLATDNLASQVPQCHPQGVPNGNKLVFQMLCGLKAASSSSPEQQEPRTKRYQGFWKNQSEMFVPTYEREDCRWPNPGEHAEKLEKLGTCQDRSMSSSAQARKTVGSVGKKYLQLLPEKKQSVLQSFFKKKMRHFVQWIFPHKKFQGQDALQKCKPKSATAQSQQSVKSRSILDSENVEAQELMTAVGQILEKKMAIHHGLHATKLKEHKREHPAPVCVCVCCLPYSTEQARMMNYTPHSQQADSKDQNCSIREKQVRPGKSLKSVRFDDEQLEVSRNPSLAPKKTLSPVSACQYRPRMPCTPGHQPHCPRHYLFRGRVLPGPCFTNLF
ncbi:spermatogenesis-associated protein 31A6-like [Pteropus medius]|uniref:spermatogenesis-associated protein 31A6-like n=1 Tax=Pteropus vampyrus TaxID=132908 RepID=UPI00196A29C4|nr:spermatogenesis-associated protein 31A6-like [Pteropus giganteus]